MASIGGSVLDTLTSGMYKNPLDTIREYIQNASDSILMAERKGVIRHHEGCATVQLLKGTQTVIISDNGLGISSDKAKDLLTNIGFSEKDLIKDAGFRGIGRLAGIGYCSKLIFRTSMRDEPKRSVVEIDCVGVKTDIKPGCKYKVEEVIARNFSHSIEDEKVEDHYFEVVMEGIQKDAGKEYFLDYKRMEAYLKQVAPVEFDAQLFRNAPLLSQWVIDQKITLPIIQLFIDAEGRRWQIFKAYKNNYETKKAKGGNYPISIRGLKFFPDTLTSDSKYWIWYADTPLLGSIDDDNVRGFRLRHKNILIGDENQASTLFQKDDDKRFNGWYLGEIHILDTRVIPNARRDWFEETSDWQEIKKELSLFLSKRVEEVRNASVKRNEPVQKVKRRVENTIRELDDLTITGAETREKRDDVLREAHELKAELIDIKEKRQGKPDEIVLEQQIEKLDNKILEISTNPQTLTGDYLKSDLNKRERKIIQDILKILEKILEPGVYKDVKTAIFKEYGQATRRKN